MLFANTINLRSGSEKKCTIPAVLLRPTSGLVFASTLCFVVRLFLMHSVFCGLMAGCQIPPSPPTIHSIPLPYTPVRKHVQKL